jgi:biotin transport system substrate-specific component
MTATAITIGDAVTTRFRWAHKAVLIVGGAALIAICAQISIHLGFTPVPITGQTFAVLVVGGTLGTLAGTASTALYVVAGAVGAPVYANHSHGWHILNSASGGYLVGFVAAAAATGYLSSRKWDRRFSSNLGALLTGNIVIYACGVLWLAHDLHLNAETALTDGLYPFVPGDLIKLYLAAAILPSSWRFLGHSTDSTDVPPRD